jgi:hypothetical protein
MTQMTKRFFTRDAIKMGLIGLVGFGYVTVATESAYANCGGHCQAGKMCGDLVGRKGVKGDQKRDEYQKCMRDPNSYK